MNKAELTAKISWLQKEKAQSRVIKNLAFGLAHHVNLDCEGRALTGPLGCISARNNLEALEQWVFTKVKNGQASLIADIDYPIIVNELSNALEKELTSQY